MLSILTANEVMRQGLSLCGFCWSRQQNVVRATNLQQFKGLFGSLPVVYAQIWEDLQKTEIQEARIDATTKVDIDSFLMAIHWLQCYPTETRQAGIFNICEKTARKWALFYARKVQALKGEKVGVLVIGTRFVRER